MTDHTDGNALAGPLGELFAVDVTAATATCAACGRQGRVAELAVYASGHGTVARCAGCEAVVLRLVRAPDSAWLDLRGAALLRVALPR